MAEDATYPPLDTPKPVAEGVWVVDSGPQRLLGLSLPIRMTALRLPDGGLWLHSPTRHTPALQAALEALGPIRHMVSPNLVHWSHVSPWRKAVPRAAFWAAPGVVERARGQDVELLPAVELTDPPPQTWEGAFELAAFRAPGFVEFAFHHRPSATLVLTDVVQAMEPARLPTVTGLLARAIGAASPGGSTPVQLRLLLGRRRAENRATAERLLALSPERVVFAHGAWFERDGAARLREALGWLLG
jgi:hypothetical protein